MIGPKLKSALWIALGLAVMITLVVTFFDQARTSTFTARIVPSSSSTFSVYYHVDGTRRSGAASTWGTVTVTYTNAQGGTEQETEAKLPWEKRIGDVPPGAPLYISASHRNPDNYGITVRIVVDDKATRHDEIRRSESTGLYAGATASALCCQP